MEYATKFLPRLHVIVSVFTTVATAQEASKCESIRLTNMEQED